MKQRIQGIIIGVIATLIIIFSGITVWATTGKKTVDITYRDIKLYVEGVKIDPKDSAGNSVEPFILGGTTYLPVRSVGEALGKAVDWDGNTNTVYIGAKTPPPPPVATKETKIFTGRLDKSDSVNTYDFTLPYASRIIFDFEHNYFDEGGNYWNIQFISKNYNEKILEFKSTGNNVKTSSPNAIYLPAGEYYVKVTAVGVYQHSNFDYTITINYEKNIGQYETENNNNIETANQISLNKAIIGNIFPYEDIDYFKFTVDKKGDIVIYFEHNYFDENGNYWNIQLYEKNTTKKLEFKVAGNQVTTSSEKINLEPGEYYIKVTAVGVYQHSTMDYTLTVKTQ